MSKVFSKQLKLQREKKGMSREQFAECLGLSVTTIESYEEYEIEPNYTTLVRISEILNVSIDRLLKKLGNFHMLNFGCKK